MLSWNPTDLNALGTYRLWEDLNMDGTGDNIVVPNMKLTTQYQVCGTGSKYFVLEYRAVICGDCDGSGDVNIGDAVCLVCYIFSDCPETLGDVDCSGDVNIADAVYLINYIFADGLAPCAGCK